MRVKIYYLLSWTVKGRNWGYGRMFLDKKSEWREVIGLKMIWVSSAFYAKLWKSWDGQDIEEDKGKRLRQVRFQ